MHLLRSLSKCWLIVSVASLEFLGLFPARGAEQLVVLNGVSLTLQDVTSQTAVYYTSMRLNRARNIWNVEVTVSNLSLQTLTAPLVLVVDSAQGTSGLLQPDGSAGVSPAVDLSRKLSQNTLPPGQFSAPQTLSFGVGSGTPALATRVFALPATATNVAVGFVRTLDQVGQPLASVVVEESGPTGQRTNQTDAAYGAGTLGNGPGQYTWKFSQTGYLPVWRRQTLATSGVAQIIFPRLTSRSTNAVPVTPLESVVISNATIAIAFASGSVNSNQTVTLTSLTAQTLPALLPLGWSPLQAFWLEMPSPPAVPPSATLQLWGPLNQGETGALVVWNSQAFEWDVLQLVTSLGGSVISTTLPGPGAYAFVVGDSAPTAPPSPQVNQPLGPATTALPDTSALAVSGQVAPSSSPASLNPDLVTGTAEIVVALTNSAGGLASGLVLECEVQEQYQLISGTAPVTPAYANYIVGYQRPGTNTTNTLQASFPIRPLRVFGPAQLNQASVSVGVVLPGPFGGVLLTTNGGQMVSGDVQLLAGVGAIASPQAMLVTALNPTNFVNLATNLVLLSAFDVTATGLLPNNSLALQLGNGPTNALLVVALVLEEQGVTGLQPVARLASDGQGRTTSLETNATDNLPGINGSGQYVIAQMTQPQALVKGTALNALGQPAGGLLATLGPWTALSRAPDGQFQLIAPAGTNQLIVNNPTTGDTGSSPLVISSGQGETTTSIGTTSSTLQIVSVSPAPGTNQVALDAGIVLTFSHVVTSASVLTNGIELLDASNDVVSAQLILDLAGTTATLLPDSQLLPATTYTIVASTNINDALGRTLQGSNQFVFTTIPNPTRSAAGQLVLYEPGATNVPNALLKQVPGYAPGTPNTMVVHGTPGTADPGVPVIIINESLGTTTTVLSGPDGSFVATIHGAESDQISATLVALNGTRLNIPTVQQLYDDGSVGLYQQGGTVAATGDGGPIQMTVPPNALQGLTKIKLTSVNVSELATQLNNVMPTNGVVAGSALNISISGTPPTLPVQFSFPVDLSTLDYPTNEAGTNACAAVAVVANAQDVTSFRILDQLSFVPQASSALSPLARRSLPRRPKGAGGGGALAGALDTSTGLLIGSLGPVGLAAQIGFNQVLVPLLFGARPVTIKGSVAAVPIAIAEQLEQAGVANAIFNFNPSQIASSAGASSSTVQGFQTLNIPLQLAQVMGLARGNVLGNGILGTIAGAVASLSIQALALQEQKIATPLSGAFITLTLSGGPLVNVPGQINPGMVYATSGDDGTFLTVAPAAGANYIAQCTHPLYSQILQNPVAPISAFPGQQGQLSLAGAVYEQFFFQLANPNETIPSAQVGIQPVQPAAGQPCTIVVTATQPTGPPNIGVTVALVGKTSLIDGKPVVANVTLNPQGQAGTTNTSPVSSQWTGVLTCDQPVRVTLKIVVQNPNAGGGGSTIPFSIAFSGPLPPTPSSIPPPPTNDFHGPVVIESDPPYHGFIGENNLITIVFNKPIDTMVTNNLTGINLNSVGTSLSSPITPVVQLSPNQRVLTLEFPGLPPSTTFQLTLTSQSIQDLAGNPLNQQPSSKTPVSFSTTFRTIADPVATIPFGTLANGRGVVISGTKMYALDQAPRGNYLDSFDITDPLQPVLINQFPLVGAPRDLVLVPQYTYVRNIQDIAQGTIQTNDLVAVVGGDLNALINQAAGTTVSEPGQYLWVFNMGDPTNPVVLASPYVTFTVGSAVTKIVWAKPYLVYQTFGSDLQSLGFVNLQEMIYGYNSTLVNQEAFGPGRPGVDANHDGEYIDPGDKIPIPPTYPPGGFYGLDFSLVLEGTTQEILDYSVTPFAETVGVTLSDGVLLDTNGVANGPHVPEMYRTFISSGQFMNFATPTDSAFSFTGAYPRWVTVFDALQIPLNGTVTTIAAALVSQQPDADGNQSLALLNISFPESPTLVSTIPIPSTLLGGNIESVWLRADGMLEVDGQQNVVVLNPALLTATNVPFGQLPTAIVDVIPGAGGIQRSQGTTSFGVHAVADGGKVEVVESPPQMQFISFPSSTTGLVDPTVLNTMGDVALQRLFAGRVTLGGLAPANIQTNGGFSSDLEPTNGPPNPALHYYVLMFAPGGFPNNNEIDLGLESLNQAGRPLSNLGAGFAPVRAVSDFTQGGTGQTPRPGCGAPIRALPAYRVSNNQNSIYYNWWLSRPFALITQAANADDVARLQGDSGIANGREILFSGANLRAFIDPGEITNIIIGSFAGQIDYSRQVIYPVSVAEALTVDRSYLLGANPPPTGPTAPFEDSYGTILSHSGETRIQDPDMVLPSPRMPIEIIRSVGNQDSYEGPFGVGWDFNYNQRLTVLDPLTFPAGLQMPIVIRDNPSDSEIAGSQDILFNSGDGRTWHYTWAGNTMPGGYTQDPLVLQFDYQDLVSDYYLPQHGIFDLLVRYKDGRFERLTPSGARYRYRFDGKLETILDRYPNNRHDLTYDANNSDLLRRIDDNSVSGPRYVQFGYYLRQGADSSFTAGLDMNTTDSWLEHKICQIVDYTGRNVLFNYTSDGFLTNRLGVLVKGENGGYAGRNHTFYFYSNCRLTQVATTVNAVPLVSAVNTINSAGQPVATASTGTKGTDNYSIPVNNSASTLKGQTTGVSLPDGSSTQRQFDNLGHVSSVTVTGTNGPPATASFSNNADGLRWYAKYPEGDSQTLTYDTNNPVLRAHGNLIYAQVNPGPRGGPSYTLSYHYDPNYNLPSGPQVDANGNTITYALTSDARDIQTITFGSAGTKTLTYNSSGQLTGTVDANGRQDSTDYDSGTGFVTSRSRGDITYTYSYDGSIPSQLGLPASIAPPLGAPTTFTYNNALQEVEIDRGASINLCAYDELGRAIYHQQQVGGGKQWTSQLFFDERGFVTNSVMSGLEVNGTVSSVSYNYTADPRLRVQSIQFPDGATQNLTYDDRGNVSQMTFGPYTEQYTHDLNNNLTAVIQGGQQVETLQYDGLDRATNVLLYSGSGTNQINLAYYNAGQLASSTVSDGKYGIVKQETADKIDALGRTLIATVHGGVISPQYRYTFNPLTATVAAPLMSATRNWDTAGNEIEFSNPDITVVLQRDANGRVMEKDRQEVGATFSQFMAYNDLDYQTNLNDLVGEVFSTAPRADGLFLGITDARGNKTTYDYSALGEMEDKLRADGMEVRTLYDAQRQVVYKGDPTAGFNYAFDPTLRLTNSTLRNGASLGYGAFNPQNMPTSLTLPGGGAETIAYDLQKRITSRSVTYGTNTCAENYTYDAVGRVRLEGYEQNNGAPNTATFDYDPAGVLLAAHFNEDGVNFNVSYSYYADGTCRSITYPSGAVITEIRDSVGRLTGISDANGNIVKAISWQGNLQPAGIQLGDNIGLTNLFDRRGRVTCSRATRSSDGSVVTHLRYQYDADNNVQVRQFIHRNGKADNLSFDVAERLSREQISTVPLAGGQFATPFYDLTYNYNPSGLDYLTSTTIATNLAPNSLVFATNWSAQDNFLLPETVDDFDRLADPMGNVLKARLWVRPADASAPQPVSAVLQHDGLGRLVSVTRVDGVTIQNQFQPGGLRYSRQVSQNGQLLSYSAYVYDNFGRMIEEYDRTGPQPVLIGRYYYASGDSPAAADLLNPSTGLLERYFLLRDSSQSVLAIVDTNGVVLERARYDSFGQPTIEERNTSAPNLAAILDAGSGSLLIAFSEPVWTPTIDPGPGDGIVEYPSLPTNAVTVSLSSTNVPGTYQWLPYSPGFPPYSVVQFTPSQPYSGPPPSGFIGWWPGSGTAADVQGGHNGALKGGATYGPGLIGEAFLLNGTSAYVQVPDSPALNFTTNDFTACLWVNFNNTAGEQVLIEKWIEGGPSGWSLIKMPGGSLRMAMSNGSGGEVDVNSGSLTLPTTNWIHYAVRRQAGQITIFTNGVSVAAGVNTANLSAATPLLFGSRGGTNFFLNGSIDEVTLYSRALSDAEITAVAGGVSDPGPITVSVVGGALADEWGNTNLAAEVSFQVYDQTGLVYFAAEPEPLMGAATAARSSLNLPFLFQGQYFDYDSGLIYLRSRFYDPYSGMFFEPDPLGYEDSVNHYAGLGNNPATLRDPTGLASRKNKVNETAESYTTRSATEEPVSRPEESPATRAAVGREQNNPEVSQAVPGNNFFRSVVGAMGTFLPRDGRGQISFGFKTTGNIEKVAEYAAMGVPTKMEKTEGKTGPGGGLVYHEGEIYTADLDGLWLQIGERFAKMSEIFKFEKRANEAAIRLGREELAQRAAEGKEIYSEDPSYPFNHGMTAHIQEEIAYMDPKKVAGFLEALGRKQPEVPDGWLLTVEGNQDNFTLSLEKISSEQVGKAFSEATSQFRERLDSKSDHYDRRLDTVVSRSKGTSQSWILQNPTVPGL